MSNTATMEEVEISEDIAFVKAYLDMELLRFGDDIVFDVSIEEEVEMSMEKVPSFILQPTIEKMLLMGLKSGSRDFTLKVNMEMEATNIKATIGLNKQLDIKVLKEFSPEQANRMQLLEERIKLVSKRIEIVEGNEKNQYKAVIRIPLN